MICESVGSCDTNAQTSQLDASSWGGFISLQKQPAQAALAQISHKSVSWTARSVGGKRGFNETGREFLGEQRHTPRDLGTPPPHPFTRFKVP